MPRGDKSAYTDKQKRQAEHIEDGYKEKGASTQEAERRAWATVNKTTGGGRKSGSGRGKPEGRSPQHAEGKPGKTGAKASVARPKTGRSAAARKAPSARTGAISGARSGKKKAPARTTD